MREKLVWKQDYSVHVPALDAQHKTLMMINKLSEEECDHALVSWAFEELAVYVKEHFSEEEKRLEKAGYADLAAHKKEHRAFEQWLSAVRQTYAIGVTTPVLLSESVHAFLRDWLVNHILGSDMRYRDLLAEDV